MNGRGRGNLLHRNHSHLRLTVDPRHDAVEFARILVVHNDVELQGFVIFHHRATHLQHTKMGTEQYGAALTPRQLQHCEMPFECHIGTGDAPHPGGNPVH